MRPLRTESLKAIKQLHVDCVRPTENVCQRNKMCVAAFLTIVSQTQPEESSHTAPCFQSGEVLIECEDVTQV